MVSSNWSCCTKGRSRNSFVSPLAEEDRCKSGKSSFPKSQPNSLQKPAFPQTTTKITSRKRNIQHENVWFRGGCADLASYRSVTPKDNCITFSTMSSGWLISREFNPRNLAEVLGHWEASGQGLRQHHFRTTSSVRHGTPQRMNRSKRGPLAPCTKRREHDPSRFPTNLTKSWTKYNCGAANCQRRWKFLLFPDWT